MQRFLDELTQRTSVPASQIMPKRRRRSLSSFCLRILDFDFWSLVIWVFKVYSVGTLSFTCGLMSGEIGSVDLRCVCFWNKYAESISKCVNVHEQHDTSWRGVTMTCQNRTASRFCENAMSGTLIFILLDLLVRDLWILELRILGLFGVIDGWNFGLFYFGTTGSLGPLDLGPFDLWTLESLGLWTFGPLVL